MNQEFMISEEIKDTGHEGDMDTGATEMNTSKALSLDDTDLYEPPVEMKPSRSTSPETTPQPHTFAPMASFPLQGPPMGSRFSPSIASPWQTHLFGCLENPQNAVITLFFPCVTFGQIAEMLDNGSTSCMKSGIMYSLFGRCTGMPCRYRSKLRAKFNLDARPAPDWVVHCFCHHCALSQEYRELQHKGFDPSIGHTGNVPKQPQNGTTPPMQQRMM